MNRGHPLVTMVSSVRWKPTCYFYGTDVHVFHQDVQALAATFGSVYSLQQWIHLTRLDRLENLKNRVQMRILLVLSSSALLTLPPSSREAPCLPYLG